MRFLLAGREGNASVSCCAARSLWEAMGGIFGRGYDSYDGIMWSGEQGRVAGAGREELAADERG